MKVERTQLTRPTAGSHASMGRRVGAPTDLSYNHGDEHSRRRPSDQTDEKEDSQKGNADQESKTRLLNITA